jgi:hypothetical protein
MDAPSVGVLLDVDREYREKARAGSLQRITPRRMNPEGQAWLPVLRTRFGPWHFTALFSNTERAHELHRVYDWVARRPHRQARGARPRAGMRASLWAGNRSH